MKAQAFVAGWPNVRIDILGLDKKGEPLNALNKAQVFVQEDRRQVNVLSVEPEINAISICLLIDSSSSASLQMKSIKAGAARILLKIAADDEVCVAHFNARLSIDQGFTLDRQADVQALQGLTASGGTALYDSIAQMVRYMRTYAKQQERALILLSDGGNNYSSLDLEKLRKDIEAPGSPMLHFIKLPESTQGVRPTSAEENADFLQMATGMHCAPFTVSEIELCADRLVAALTNRYALTFVTANQAKDGRLRRIDVKLDKDEQKARAEIRAPEGYYAPSQ